MDDGFEFEDQLWKLRRPGALTIELWHDSPQRETTYVQAIWELVPDWLEENDFSTEHETLFIDVIASIWQLTDWRELDGHEFACAEPVEADGKVIRPTFFAPNIRIFSHDKNGVRHRRQVQAGGKSLFRLSQREGYNFHGDMEDFYGTDRCHKATVSVSMDQFFGREIEDDDERLQWLDEGETIRYGGPLRLDHIRCAVPVNTAQPVEWAKKLTARRIQFTDFGRCQVAGADWQTGKYEPTDGVADFGRNVIIFPRNEA